MQYSATTNSFYDPAVHGRYVPDDVREITRTDYAALLAGQSEGKKIVALDGVPILIDPLLLTLEEQAAVKYQEQITRINGSCESALTGGFASDALGTTHQYSSQLDDQLNLTGVILAGVESPYPCRDEQGRKEFRLHTFAQLRRVGDDFTQFKLQLLQKANQLKQQLDLALADIDLAAIQAVTWEDLPS